MRMRGGIDAREFTRAVQLYEKATQKDEADILNRAGKNVSFRAAQFTPKATGAKIKAELMRDKLAIRILSARRKFRGMTMQKRSAVTRRFIAARVRSARYVSAGWANAIAAFGGNASRFRVNPKSEAAKGYGIRARANKLVAELANNARGADRVALSALQDAIDFVAKDMTSFAQRKLQNTADKFSVKGAK